MQGGRISGAAVAVVLVAGLSGCGSDDGADPAPAPTSTSSSSTTSSAPPSSSTPSTPTTPSTPAVEPATGREVRIGDLSMRIPEGWRYNDGGINPFIRGGSSGGGSQFAQIGSSPDLSGGNSTLDSLVQNLIQSSYPDRAPKRLADREIDGVLFARLKGPIDDRYEVEHYIALYQGNTVEIEFDLVRDDGEAANTAIVEGCLATVEIG